MFLKELVNFKLGLAVLKFSSNSESFVSNFSEGWRGVNLSFET